jgi:hypothetical protein
MLELALMLMMGAEFTPTTVDDASGRYLGFRQVGNDPYGYQSLELTLSAKPMKAVLVWRRRDQREKKELQLVDIKVDPSGLSATVKGDRPPGVPEKLRGRFVLKGPGSNAKGAVERGLLLDGDWFLAVTNGT